MTGGVTLPTVSTADIPTGDPPEMMEDSLSGDSLLGTDVPLDLTPMTPEDECLLDEGDTDPPQS